MSAAVDQDRLEELGRQYMDENPDMYDDADLEALGAAVYVEQTPQEDEIAFTDIAEYIFQNDGFQNQKFKSYKESMGGRRFEEDIIGRVSDLVDETSVQTGRSKAYSTVWEALYREKAEDLDEADEVIEGILQEISGLEGGGEAPTQSFDIMSPTFNFGVMEEQSSGGVMSPTYNFGQMGGNLDEDLDDWDDVEDGGDFDWGRTGGMGRQSPVIYNPQFVVGGGNRSFSSSFDESNNDGVSVDDWYDGGFEGVFGGSGGPAAS